MGCSSGWQRGRWWSSETGRSVFSRGERSGERAAADELNRSQRPWWARLLGHLGVAQRQQTIAVEVVSPPAPVATAERLFYDVARAPRRSTGSQQRDRCQGGDDVHD